MFHITTRWLRQNSTGMFGGGYTKTQLASIGVGWPPPAGWLYALEGSQITDEQKVEFERAGQERRDAIMKTLGRHRRMSEEVFYTWPDPEGGWHFSDRKPEWWGEPWPRSSS